MKKATIVASTFLVVFGLTMGILVSLNEDAMAGPMCGWECQFTTDWTFQTGPECPGTCPAGLIYKVVRRSTCTGGPLNCPSVYEVVACWDGVIHIGCVLRG